MRVAAIIVLLLLLVPGAYAASATGTTKLLGVGSDSVPHCQVQDYSIAASDTISSIDTQVECDLTGELHSYRDGDLWRLYVRRVDRRPSHCRHLVHCGRSHQPIGGHNRRRF